VRASDDCEFCGGPNEVTLKAEDGFPSIVRACRRCERKIRAGKALVDIYDFAWWKDKDGIHAAHVDDKKALKGCKAREDVRWQKVPLGD